MRRDRGLQRACEETERLMREIEALYSEYRLDGELVQLRSLATVATLIARSARQFLESRGVHYNCDHPARRCLLAAASKVHWCRLI